MRGQLAHLNRNAADTRFDNLAWLCLNHHDEYDSRTSQSRGLTEGEVRHWRDELVRKFEGAQSSWGAGLEDENFDGVPSLQEVSRASSNNWQFPVWLMDGQMELFAFKASFDGVCLIERIYLPDGRVVIACVQAPGNPGTSITNAAERIATQIRKRLEIDPAELVWLEHYLEEEPSEWSLVKFEWDASDEQFRNPSWTVMEPETWRLLGLRPRKKLEWDSLSVQSKIDRLF